MEIGIERRAAAPHPGPIIKRDYLDELGYDEAVLADHLELDPERLRAMLEGRASIDADAAVRMSRALQIPAERIMQMQLRCDFAAARRAARLQAIGVLRPVGPQPFPDEGFLRGRLGRSGDEGTGDVSLFFQEDVEHRSGDDYAGFHALWRGDRLRIYEPDGAPRWVGPILQNLDGHILLPFVRIKDWHAWFAAGSKADLAIGPEHAAFFARMRVV